MKHQICTNCVIDTTDSAILFDEKRVCDHCNTFYQHTLPNWHTDQQGQLDLDHLIVKIKKAGVGKDFDCIVGMSGGIDSSYLTYLAKEQFGLRPLVFHVYTIGMSSNLYLKYPRGPIQYCNMIWS